MIKLNVLDILEQTNTSRYSLFNKLNNIRVMNSEKQISYTNFIHLIEQSNFSIRYQDIDELCQALECKPGELFSKIDNKKE